VTNATREGQEAGNSLRAGQAANTGMTEERLGVGFGVEVAASLPAREAVATFAETVRRGATEARGDVARLRGRANEVQSASAEAARMRRAIVGIERLIHAAHDATTDVENVARASDVQGFAEAALQASSAAARYSRSLALERLADLPTELDAATAKNHPGAVDSPPPVETGGVGVSRRYWGGRVDLGPWRLDVPPNVLPRASRRRRGLRTPSRRGAWSTNRTMLNAMPTGHAPPRRRTRGRHGGRPLRPRLCLGCGWATCPMTPLG
jgi:hypothetical protein